MIPQNPPVTPHPPPGPVWADAMESPPDQTRGYRPQGTADWLLIFTLEGEGFFRFRDEVLSALPGSLVAIRPGTPQDYGQAPGATCWRLFWAHFVPGARMIDWLDWPVLGPGIHHLMLPDSVWCKVQTEFSGVIQRSHGGDVPGQEWALNHLERLLLVAREAGPGKPGEVRDLRIRQLNARLAEKMEESWPVERMARSSGLGRSRFLQLFHSETGTTPRKFLEILRLERARRLLISTNWTLEEISIRVGFESPFYLSIRFKKWLGCAPRTYRQRFALSPRQGIFPADPPLRKRAEETV